MMMTSALLWRRTRTSAPLGTNPRNRIQWGPLVYLVTVFLTLWLQQTNVIVVRHTPMYVHLTIGLHLLALKQEFVSISCRTTVTKTAQPGDTACHEAAPACIVPLPNTSGDTSPKP